MSSVTSLVFTLCFVFVGSLAWSATEFVGEVSDGASIFRVESSTEAAATSYANTLCLQSSETPSACETRSSYTVELFDSEEPMSIPVVEIYSVTSQSLLSDLAQAESTVQPMAKSQGFKPGNGTCQAHNSRGDCISWSGPGGPHVCISRNASGGCEIVSGSDGPHVCISHDGKGHCLRWS